MRDQQTQKPYHLFKGMIQLVTFDFEKLFFQFNKEFHAFSESGWSLEAKTRGLFIDLSQVRWVELGAAAQTVLLVESAKLEGLKIYISLPLKKLSKGESEFLTRRTKISDEEFHKKTELFEGLRLSRELARNYLTTIQFQRAIDCPHVEIGEVTFLDDYPFESGESVGIVGIEESSSQEILKTMKRPEEVGYKFLIPLTWINVNEHDSNLDFIENKFTEILSQSDRGLDSIDAQAIKNVIINELLKNVKQHTSRNFALMGVALQPSKILFTDYFISCERNFIDNIHNLNTNYISIYFGDSGNGLCKKLNEAYKNASLNEKNTDYNIIKWSFNKWSTSKLDETIRGTKGLYRILRIINKYNGLMTIRTAKENAGFQKGGNVNSEFIFEEEKKVKNHLSWFPGTFLKMIFTPFKELTKFNISFTQNKNYKDYTWTTKTICLDSTKPSNTFKNDLSVKRIFKETKDNFLFLIDSQNSKLKNLDDIEEAIKNHLIYLSEARHPNGVIVYGFPGGWEKIESIVNSVNSMIQEKRFKTDIYAEAEHPDKEEIFDTVLVLGENRQYCWIGDDNDIMDCLNELYQSDYSEKNISELKAYNKLDLNRKTKVLQYFFSDDALVSLENNKILRYNFIGLKPHLSSKIHIRLNKISSAESKKFFYISPNLRKVKHWVNIENLIQEDLQRYALVLSIALKELIKDLPNNLSNYKILIDSHSSFKLAVEFSNWMGIPPKNIIIFNDEVDGKLPKRNPIFEEKDNVLILTTIISTKETAKRSIKAIIRDLANPIAVLSIINQSVDDPIRIWDIVIPVASLVNNVNFEITSEEISNLSFTPIYKSPIGYSDELFEEADDDDDDLYELIKNQKALHFNHLGKENGRHFTFYLNATRLLNNEVQSENLIYNKFNLRIEEWLNQSNENKFDIWRPAGDFKLLDPLNKISNKIYLHFTLLEGYSCNHVLEIKKSTNFGEWTFINPDENFEISSGNVVIIDWGSLTGNTIQQLLTLAVNAGYRKILVCVLFSQLPQKEEQFLKKIRQIDGFKLLKKNELFASTEVEKITADVSINFFYKLTLNNYESIDCPVCEQIHSLREFEIKSKHMANFNLSRREMLKIKDRDKTDLEPKDFYDSELDIDIILEMFKFRKLLEYSLLFTRKREELKNYLDKLLEGINEEKKNSKSNIYAVLFFLSVEIMWMQKPPLMFHSIRKILTQIAKTIAIWPIEESKKYFSDEQSIIRYKFAAISVLRSSNKVEFINSFDKIFLSSKNSDSYSNCLTQNLFFHTYSYIKKEYHKSHKHLDTVINNLSSIVLQNDLPTNIKQVIIYLKSYTEKRKFEFYIPTHSKMSIFSSFKKEIIENYGSSYKHNNVSDDFMEVKPVDYIEILTKFYKKDSTFQNIQQVTESPGFINWLNNVDKRWSDVASYLNRVVINHFGKLDNLLNSRSFSSIDTEFSLFIKQLLSEKKLFGVNDELTLQINEIISNPSILSDKKNFDRYMKTWDLYNQSFMYINKNSISLSCPLLRIAEQTPSKLFERINKAIIESRKIATLEKIKINFENYEIEEIMVFFPDNQLKHFLDQVFKYNLFTHHIEGEPINVKFDYIFEETENLILKIISTGTQPRKKNIGGLNNFIAEFALFDGHLNYEYDTFKKQFEIEIKLLIWENGI